MLPDLIAAASIFLLKDIPSALPLKLSSANLSSFLLVSVHNRVRPFLY